MASFWFHFSWKIGIGKRDHFFVQAFKFYLVIVGQSEPPTNVAQTVYCRERLPILKSVPAKD